MKPYFFPIFFFIILLISSFLPVIPIILLYLNGGFFYLIEVVTKLDPRKILTPLNFALSIPMLFAYYKSTKNIYKFIFAALFTFFVYGFFMLIFEESLILSEFYFLQFIIEPFIVGISLFTVDYLKFNDFIKK